MSLHDIFALLVGSLTLSTAVMVILSRNAVYSAIFLLLTLLGVAAEYALLTAHFLAVIQILVYAGAVVVLIVFVLMMMGFGREKLQGLELPVPAVMLSGLIGATLLAAGGVGIIKGKSLRVKLPPPKVQTVQRTLPVRVGIISRKNLDQKREPGSIYAIGYHLVTQNLLAFELICVVLLMAILGVIVLLREPEKDDSSALASLHGEGH